MQKNIKILNYYKFNLNHSVQITLIIIINRDVNERMCRTLC